MKKLISRFSDIKKNIARRKVNVENFFSGLGRGNLMPLTPTVSITAPSSLSQRLKALSRDLDSLNRSFAKAKNEAKIQI